MRGVGQRRSGRVGAGRSRALQRVLRLRGEIHRRQVRACAFRRRCPPAVAASVRELAVAAFRAIDGAGLARVDFLLSGKTGELYLNELNTLPGFTAISMYPKLWEATGLPYDELVERLIDLALERHGDRLRSQTSFHGGKLTA